MFDDFEYIFLKFKSDFSLGAIHSDAYEAYQTSHDLKSVVEKTCVCDSSKVVINKNTKMNINLSLLTPILPMLVSVCMCKEIYKFQIKLDFYNC